MLFGALDSFTNNAHVDYNTHNVKSVKLRRGKPACSVLRGTLMLLVLFLLTVHSIEAMPLVEQQQQQQRQQVIDEASLLSEAIQAAAAAVAQNVNSNLAVDSASAEVSPGRVDAVTSSNKLDAETTGRVESILESMLRQQHRASHQSSSSVEETTAAASPVTPTSEEVYVKKILQQSARGGKQQQLSARRANGANQNKNNNNSNNKVHHKIKYSSQSLGHGNQAASGNINSLHYNPLNNKKIFRADPNLQRLEKKSWKIPIKSIALYSENSKDLQASQMIGDLKELFDTFKDS
jgi:hypothetical protein